MVTKKKSDPAPAPTGTLAVDASLDASHRATILRITGASEGGHSLFVIAMRPDGRREDIGTVTWEGRLTDLTIPFVARWVRLMSNFDDPDRVEMVVDVVQDFIDDQPPTEPPPEEPPPPAPEPDPVPEGATP